MLHRDKKNTHTLAAESTEVCLFFEAFIGDRGKQTQQTLDVFKKILNQTVCDEVNAKNKIKDAAVDLSL